MAERRATGARKPPPRAETMSAFFADLVGGLDVGGELIIGGKSMGGRIASLIVDDLAEQGKANGLICLGYPFHPPGKPDRLRVEGRPLG